MVAVPELCFFISCGIGPDNQMMVDLLLLMDPGHGILRFPSLCVKSACENAIQKAGPKREASSDGIALIFFHVEFDFVSGIFVRYSRILGEPMRSVTCNVWFKIG